MNIEQFLTELDEKAYLNLENTKEITLFSECIEEFVKDYKYNIDLEVLETFSNNLNARTFEELMKKGWFRQTNITSITIPDSITSIGKFAFYSCFSLTSIDIPNSVTSIGDYAFYFCESLKTIYLEKGIKEEIKSKIKKEYPEIEIVEK